MAKCAKCGYEIAAFASCPFCGEIQGSSGPGGLGVPMDEKPAVNLPSWENPEVPFPANLFETWRSSLFQPGAFFANGPFDRPAGRPILYYLLVGVLGAALALAWGAVLPDTQPSMFEALTVVLNPGGEDSASDLTAGARLVDFFLAPFWAILSLILWSALLHVLVLLLVPDRRSFTATVRTVCYAAGPGIFVVVPWLGGLVAGVWGVVLTVIGLREAHRTTTGRALAVWLLSMAIPVAILVVLLMAFFARVASGI